MKIMITFCSLLVVLASLIPFFGKNFPIPNTGTGYSIVLFIIGVLLVIMAIMNSLMMGFERFVLIMEGLIVATTAALTFLPKFLAFIPRDGLAFQGIILITGAVCLLYGLIGMG